jgi:hypothetical protein
MNENELTGHSVAIRLGVVCSLRFCVTLFACIIQPTR